MVEENCLCWDLKTGLTFFAFTELMFWHTANCIFVSLLIAGFTFLGGDDFMPRELWHALSFYLIPTAFELVHTYCFFFGVRIGKKPLLLVVLWTQWIEMIFQVNFILLMGYSTQDLSTEVFSSIIVVILSAYHYYVWLCSLWYYKSLSDRENNGATDSNVDAEKVVITAKM